MDPDSRCPCGTGHAYSDCCGRIHAGYPAPTAERLMRSRFTAFAIGDVPYLLRSWHPSTRPQTLELDAAQRWLYLEILDREAGGLLDNEGVVEFVATFRLDGERHDQRERSRFTRHDGAWMYLNAAS